MASPQPEIMDVLKINFQVKWWITFNEPQETCRGYSDRKYAPYLKLNNTGYFMAGHVQLLAHSKVYHLYNELYRNQQKGNVEKKCTNNCYKF